MSGRRLLLLLTGVLLGTPAGSIAYEKATHALITSTALERSTAHQALKTYFAVDAGTGALVRERELTLWAEMGARAEDDFPRFANHFHDPLREWDQAGWRLTVPYLPWFGARLGDSSVVWAQRDGPGQGWSWNDVRQYFLQALTLASKAERDDALARTFEGLGRLLHLLQDAASPAHTRNDPHVRPNYETFVGKLEEADLRALAASPVAPDRAWPRRPVNSAAPVPVSALFDADVYLGANPHATTAPLVGLGEYTNANFFSEDTAFGRMDVVGRRFPYPASSSVKLAATPLTLPSGETVQRLYYWKDADGDTGYRLATVGLLQDYQTRSGSQPAVDPKPFLDDAVYADYAAKLVPRAVGYSTALVDYFFRGRLGATVFCCAPEPSLMIQNLTDEPLEGVFELHALRGDARERVATFGSADAPRRLGAWGFSLETLPRSFTPAKRFLLLFHGRLGKESAPPGYPGAVAAVVFEMQFVFAVQESFEGPAAQFNCRSGHEMNPIDHSKAEWLGCYWLPRVVRIPGYFRTNWDKPIIQRITLNGVGSTSRPPVLVVDGIAQPGVQWVRERPDQPDPQTFVVTHAGLDRTPFYWLHVETKNGTSYETQLATIDIGGSLVERVKEYVPERETYLVRSGRNAWMEVASELASESVQTARFRTQSINGRTNPTEQGGRTFGDTVYPEGTRVADVTWEHDVIDVFTAIEGSDDADTAYAALPGLEAFVDPIVDNRPSVAWTASVARDYTAAELDFFRLFAVTPPSYVIPLTAR